MRARFLSMIFAFTACSAPTPTPPSAPAGTIPEAASAAPPSTSSATVASPAPLDGGAVDASQTEGPFGGLAPSLPIDLSSATKPAPVKRSGKAWPFHAWDRAEAVILNWVPYGSDTVYRAYNDAGWTHKLAYRTSLDPALARRAVELVLEAKGQLEVSKCAVPRHAIVLFDGETPVASINVCFSCHDILLWPPTPSAPNADKRSEAVLPK